MAHDVFISYATEDKGFADAVRKALERGGVRCWYAPRDVPYTVDYEEAIVDAIAESRMMVLILSSHSNSSVHVKREVQNACREGPEIPVLPVQIENVTLNKSLKYYIGSVQWLSALGVPLEAHLESLVDYVRARLLPHERGEDVAATVGGRAEDVQPRAEDEAEEWQRQEEEGRRRQEAEAQRRKKEEEHRRASDEQTARLERLWDEAGEEVARKGHLPEEEHKRAAAPPQEMATEETGQPSVKTLQAPPPEKIVPSSSAGSPVVATKARLSRRTILLALGLVALTGLFIFSILTLYNLNTGGQTSGNSSQSSVDNLAQKDSNTKMASAPTAGPPVVDPWRMEFVYVPADSFIMGSEKADYEKPVHLVTIPNGFYIGRYEVTQEQWQAVMGGNPSGFKNCDQCPVENVTWNEVQEFVRRLNARGSSLRYRLPTESEWEYACRAGATTEFAFGDSLSSEQANFDGNAPYGGAAKGVNRQQTMPVGYFQRNEWGLYDMHGNVREWCQDAYRAGYEGAPADGSARAPDGKNKRRVVRGGSWRNPGDSLRSAARDHFEQDNRSPQLGFRLVAERRSNP
ncbi:MAG TPA: SUMF1/EgtB/PvdO family nonheme iron enzyme [Pyrinomonadaceae bacterium]|nr:SUMF1/EgtB/PvdO family nonheme iron enzyme [Pyrinomonadaceae bacterium]